MITGKGGNGKWVIVQFPNPQSPVLVKNDLLAIIDSDNIPLLKNWLERMVEPFQNAEL